MDISLTTFKQWSIGSERCLLHPELSNNNDKEKKNSQKIKCSINTNR